MPAAKRTWQADDTMLISTCAEAMYVKLLQLLPTKAWGPCSSCTVTTTEFIQPTSASCQDSFEATVSILSAQATKIINCKKKGTSMSQKCSAKLQFHSSWNPTRTRILRRQASDRRSQDVGSKLLQLSIASESCAGTSTYEAFCCLETSPDECNLQLCSHCNHVLVWRCLSTMTKGMMCWIYFFKGSILKRSLMASMILPKFSFTLTGGLEKLPLIPAMSPEW